MTKKKIVKKQYLVNIDMTWSENVSVTATNAREAKRKAWEKFKNGRSCKKSNFKLCADEI